MFRRVLVRVSRFGSCNLFRVLGVEFDSFILFREELFYGHKVFLVCDIFDLPVILNGTPAQQNSRVFFWS